MTREERNEYQKAWYQNHKEQVRQQRKIRREANKDIYLERERRYRDAHREQIIETQKRFKENHPDYFTYKALKERKAKKEAFFQDGN